MFFQQLGARPITLHQHQAAQVFAQSHVAGVHLRLGCEQYQLAMLVLFQQSGHELAQLF